MIDFLLGTAIGIVPLGITIYKCKKGVFTDELAPIFGYTKIEDRMVVDGGNLVPWRGSGLIISALKENPVEKAIIGACEVVKKSIQEFPDNWILEKEYYWRDNFYTMLRCKRSDIRVYQKTYNKNKCYIDDFKITQKDFQNILELYKKVKRDNKTKKGLQSLRKKLEQLEVNDLRNTVNKYNELSPQADVEHARVLGKALAKQEVVKNTQLVDPFTEPKDYESAIYKIGKAVHCMDGVLSAMKSNMTQSNTNASSVTPTKLDKHTKSKLVKSGRVSDIFKGQKHKILRDHSKALWEFIFYNGTQHYLTSEQVLDDYLVILGGCTNIEYLPTRERLQYLASKGW